MQLVFIRQFGSGIPARGLADRIRFTRDWGGMGGDSLSVGVGFIPPVDGVEEEYHPA